MKAELVVLDLAEYLRSIIDLLRDVEVAAGLSLVLIFKINWSRAPILVLLLDLVVQNSRQSVSVCVEAAPRSALWDRLAFEQSCF